MKMGLQCICYLVEFFSAITYHHKTSVHASQMNWYLWRDVKTFDKNSDKLFIPSAKQGFQNVVQISIRIFDPHTSGIFCNTRRVALNTGVNKSYPDRKFPALNYVTERVSQQCFDQQVSHGVTNVKTRSGNWGLRNLRNLTNITYFDWNMFYTAVSMMMSQNNWH